MRRRAPAAVALSVGLFVLTTPVPTGPTAAHESAHPAQLAVDRAIPDEPVLVDPGSGGAGSGWHAAQPASYDLSGNVLAAYLRAVAASPPQCHLPVSLLAAIGQVESGNLAGRLDADNRAVPAILGPVLDGRGTRAVADTDGGQWDGDPVWDRALGPLQLIPSSWRAVGVDLDGDGVRDPQDLDDAAGGAMVYLCGADRDLATTAGLRTAILSYNHSRAYLRSVLAWKAAFDAVDPALWGSSTPLLQARLIAAGGSAGPGATASAKPAATAPHQDAHTTATAAAPVTAPALTAPAPAPASPPEGSGAPATSTDPVDTSSASGPAPAQGPPVAGTRADAAGSVAPAAPGHHGEPARPDKPVGAPEPAACPVPPAAGVPPTTGTTPGVRASVPPVDGAEPAETTDQAATDETADPAVPGQCAALPDRASGSTKQGR